MMRRLSSRRELGRFPLDAGFTSEIILVGGGIRTSPEQTAITAVVWLCRVRHSLTDAAKSEIRNNWAGLGVNVRRATHTMIHGQRKRAAAACAETQSSAGFDSFAQCANH